MTNHEHESTVSWSSFCRHSRRVNRQGFPRCRAANKAVKILQHALLLRRDIWVPHHHQQDYSFFVGVISCPVQVARVHAKKPGSISGDPSEKDGPGRGEGRSRGSRAFIRFASPDHVSCGRGSSAQQPYRSDLWPPSKGCSMQCIVMLFFYSGEDYQYLLSLRDG